MITKATEVAFYKAMLWNDLFLNIYYKFHAQHIKFRYDLIDAGFFRYYYSEALRELTPSVTEIKHRWEFTKATFSFPHRVEMYIKERFPEGQEVETTLYHRQLLLDLTHSVTPFFDVHRGTGSLDGMRRDYVRQVQTDIHHLVSAHRDVLSENDTEIAREFWTDYLSAKEGQIFES